MKRPEDPQYIQKRRQREREKRDRQKHEANLATINSIANELAATKKQSQSDDDKRAFREKLTIALLIATVVAAGLGDVFFYGQLREAKKLYGPIAQQASAASQSSNALINSERGKVFINTIKLKKSTDADPHPQIDYSFINLGRSPILTTTVYAQCQLIGNAVPLTPIYDKSKGRVGQNAVGSNASFGSTGASPDFPACIINPEMTAQDWEEVTGNTKFFFLSGYVYYQDAFYKYRWYFGDIYRGEIQLFSTYGLPSAYNDETQEEYAKAR